MKGFFGNLWGSAVCALCIGFLKISFNACSLIGKARLLDSWWAENHWRERHLFLWGTVVSDVKTLPEFLVFTLEGTHRVNWAKRLLSSWEKSWPWLLTYPSFTGIYTENIIEMSVVRLRKNACCKVEYRNLLPNVPEITAQLEVNNIGSSNVL